MQKLNKTSMNKFYITMLCLGQMAFAQTFENEKVIDSIAIKGRKKIKQERADFAYNGQSTEILGSYEIERNNPIFVEQSLGTMAGVQVERRTEFGGQRVVLRGYGNDQKFNNWGVKFYLNSAPITNADGVTILEDLDFSLINQMKVVKGPAATMYGGGSGGAVQFFMNPETKKGVSLTESLTLGAFNLFHTNTRVDAVSDKSSIMFSYGHLQSDGYRPRGNTNKNNYAFLGNFKLNNQQELMVFTSHNNSFQGVTGQISLEDYYQGKDPGNGAYARTNAANHFISTRAIIGHKWQISNELENNTSIFFHHLDTKRTAAGATEDSQQPNYGFRTTFTWKKEISDDFENLLEAGAEYQTSRSQISNYRFDGKLTTPDLQTRPISRGSYFKYNNFAVSSFLVNRISYKPLDATLLLGVSANNQGYKRTDLLAYPGLVEDYNRDLSFEKKFSPILTPHLALQKKIGRHILNLSYSEGYNAPTASTAHIRGTASVNDNLKAEKSTMWDFSAHGLLAGTKLDYQISLFQIDVKDKLTQLWNSANGGYSYWGNTGHQANKGIEISLGYMHTSNGFFKKIEPYFNFSGYDFKYKNFENQDNNGIINYSGKKVVGVPSIKYSIGLDFDTQIGLYLRNTFNYLSDVYTDFSNETNVKGFSQYNAKIGYKKSFGNWEADVYLAGNNLTNQINYAFVFVGNAVGDNDLGNGYPVGTITDINPGYAKSYFFGGMTLKYNF